MGGALWARGAVGLEGGDNRMIHSGLMALCDYYYKLVYNEEIVVSRE